MIQPAKDHFALWPKLPFICLHPEDWLEFAKAADKDTATGLILGPIPVFRGIPVYVTPHAVRRCDLARWIADSLGHAVNRQPT